jgi:hypothetical protein
MRLCRLVLGVALSLAVVGSACAKSPSLITVKIIGLNDFHGNLQPTFKGEYKLEVNFGEKCQK